MTANESNPGVLVNAPVKFAGATPDVKVTPQPPAGVPVEGLPQASFREVIKRDGSREGAVQAVVDPPLGGNYLNIALYVKGPRDTQRQLIERKPVAPADQNDPVYFNVFQSLLNDGVHVFTYEVERTSGNSGPSTESWALYHRDLPGGNDVPGTGDHPDLRISLPPELGNPPQIGKDEVDRGVAVRLSYPFMKAYDVITLELNRERFTFTVQPGEEGKPFVITVTRSMFERAGSHPEFPISYTAKDQVNNPTHNRRWSQTLKANVDTERVTLTAPDIAEDPDDPSDDPSTIKLENVRDYLYVLVHVFSPLWAVGDTVRLSYICTPQIGSAVTHTVEVGVGRLPFTHRLQVPVAKVLPKSKVLAVYELVRGGNVIGRSKAAEAQVIGEPVSDEQPVITAVTDSKGNEIAPGGTTVDKNVTLKGTATKGRNVQIYDGITAIGQPVNVNLSDGSWSFLDARPSDGIRNFTAKALYGSEKVSHPWSIKIIRPLDIDTSKMILNGLAVYVGGWEETNDPIENNNATRRPTSGVLPISYTSGNSNIAVVTQEGVVTGRMNGETYVEVKDANGSIGRYPVAVSNIHEVVFSSTMLTPQQAGVWAREQGQVGDSIALNAFVLPMNIRYNKYKVDNLPEYPSITQVGNDGYVRRGWCRQLALEVLVEAGLRVFANGFARTGQRSDLLQ
ncbi:hypothetical protein [Pseudomonas sp. NPDC099000]|uniref:hypothetical protein n=1 Tax=Pseudomonas sp. NPDC099000 TaxID=3364488 RepID=UPI00383A262C